jgi:putative peptidoglycan lipid II flippase
VYAALVSKGEGETADRVAGAVGALLSVLVAILVALGVWLTPWIIAAIAPGFVGEKRALTVVLVRILFPGAGLLVMSAWCLGVLNSHHRFLLSYAAPVMWNVAMIGTLALWGRSASLPALAVWLAWGSVVGSLAQVVVQVPVVLRVAPSLRLALDTTSEHVRAVGRNFLPVLVSRGVVQISAYIDALLASLLPTGAVTGIANAQLLYTLPVSLFGMSVAAAELPSMSGEAAEHTEQFTRLRERLDAGLRRIAFFVVPSAMAFLALGDVLVGALLQTGRFTRADSVYVWGILAGSAVGLLASTLGRLYSSTYYALRDTRTPLRFAVVRVALTTVLGYLFALPLPRILGLSQEWGAAGLTLSAGLAGWVEFALLRRGMNARIGRTGLAPRYLATLWLAAAGGGAVAWAVKLTVPPQVPLVAAVLILVPYGVVFGGASVALSVPEATAAFRRAQALVSRRS